MSTTLREIYVEKQYEALQEAIDMQKLQTMVQNIGAIENTIAPVRNKLPLLAQAINRAKELAASKLAGESGWKRIAQNIGDKFNLVDDMKNFITFQAGVMQGLRALPGIITLLKKSGIDIESGQSLEQLFAGNAANKEQIIKALGNAFRPPGGIFRGKPLPFVKNPTTMAIDFFKLTPNEVEQMASRAGQLPGIPLSSQDTKQLMSSNNQDAAQQLAGGAETNPTGKDAAGQSTQSQPTKQGVSSSTPAAAQPGATSTSSKGRLPDFNTAMQAIGARNVDSPENKKTVDTFRRFYDYLSKNSA